MITIGISFILMAVHPALALIPFLVSWNTVAGSFISLFIVGYIFSRAK